MARIPETITVSDSGFGFPTSEILTGRGFITGKSGAGKSNSSNVIAEELLELGLPFVIVDVDGEYWGLKDRYAIQRAGRGEEVDVDLSFETIPDLVGLVLDETTPLILDLAEVPEEETDDLLEEFVRRLFDRENDVRKPCLLFVEELHEFLPQRGGHDDLATLLIRVAKRGRKRGLGMCGMSQRPAAVDKDFITQCDWIVWHRLTWENDVSVVSQILGSEAAKDVQRLDTGEALVMTDWDEEVTRVQFRRKRTFDAGATPDLSSFSEDDLQPKRQSSSGSGGSSNSSGGTSSASKPSVSGSAERPSGGGAAAASTSTDGGSAGRETEFDPVAEVALLAAHGVGAMMAFVFGVTHAVRSLPAVATRATPRRAASLSLTDEHYGRPRDRVIEAAIVLLVLVGVGTLILAVYLAFAGGG